MANYSKTVFESDAYIIHSATSDIPNSLDMPVYFSNLSQLLNKTGELHIPWFLVLVHSSTLWNPVCCSIIGIVGYKCEDVCIMFTYIRVPSW